MNARVPCHHCGTKNVAEIHSDDVCEHCSRPLLEEQEGQETPSLDGTSATPTKGNRALYYIVVGALGMHLAGDRLDPEWFGPNRYAIEKEYALVDQCIHGHDGLGKYASADRKRYLCVCGLEQVQTEYGAIPDDGKDQKEFLRTFEEAAENCR